MWEHPYTDCVCPVSPLGELDSLRYPLSRGWGWSWVWGRPLPLPSGWHPAGTGSDPSCWRQGSGPGWLCSLRVCVFPSPCVGSLAPEPGSTDQSGTHVDPLQAEVWAVCLPELHLFPCSAHTQPHVHVPLAPHSPSLCPASTTRHRATLQGPWGLCVVSGYILRELWGRGCCQSARLLLMRHLSKCQPWLLPPSRLCPRPGLPLDAVPGGGCGAEVYAQAGNLAATRALVQLPPLPCSPCGGTQASMRARARARTHTHTHTHTPCPSFPQPSCYSCLPASQPGVVHLPQLGPQACSIPPEAHCSLPGMGLCPSVLPLPSSPLSGAQVLTWSLFFLSSPITCGSLSQPWLYRSFSASFQWELFHI